MNTFLFHLKVSRPGLWFPTLWLYMLPLGNQQYLSNPIFWIGLVYVLFPMNFMVYGWNDLVDIEADKENPRKDSYLFGARGNQSQLKKIIPYIILSQLLFYPFFIYVAGYELLFIYALQLGILLAYNFPGKGLRSMPPFEMICQFGYLLVVPFSVYLNQVDSIPWQTYLYLCAFAVQAHLMGEVMDIEPDRKTGKKTTATTIGRMNTKLLIMLLVGFEIGVVYTCFYDILFLSMLIGALLWLTIDAFILFKNRNYTLFEMNLFGFSSNILGIATIIYIQYSSCLLIVK